MFVPVGWTSGPIVFEFAMLSLDGPEVHPTETHREEYLFITDPHDLRSLQADSRLKSVPGLANNIVK
jgi:hypothetical protein